MSGYTSSEPTPNEKGCWYLIEVDYCPVCMSERTERTRMPAPKPDRPEDRFHLNERYDYCLG